MERRRNWQRQRAGHTLAMGLANGETGAITEPPAKVDGRWPYGAARADWLFLDVAQAAGRIPFDFAASGADFAILSAHKLGGPKGVGALIVRAGVDIEAAKGPWYKEIGQGMGAALNTAAAMNAYVLSDRGTWLSFKNRGELDIAVEGDKRLFNQYGVMLVNPQKHPSVKAEAGQRFIDWLVSPEAQREIETFGVEQYGEPLFVPDAGKTDAQIAAGS